MDMKLLLRTYLTTIKKIDEKEKIVYNNGIDLDEFAHDYRKLLSLLMKEVFNEHQREMIDWWLYESVPKMLYFHDNTVALNVEDMEDFIKYIVDGK